MILNIAMCLKDAYYKLVALGLGTAEYSSDKSKSHAWFIGYAAGDKPELAVCVLVEEAGSGSEYAVPIAKRIFDAYYAD